uniref:E3 ubiquitin-protein ligase RNF217 n=1 Tax=Geotrypetes seraphini TaxID=260995 RepID=A0A6P8Q9P1_GEOSA|nr:probable E3 ubiquitin-protein ligase RNF217 [Geotrypetes seraphini]
MGSWPPGMGDEHNEVNIVAKADLLPCCRETEEERRLGPPAGMGGTGKQGRSSLDFGRETERDWIYLELHETEVSPASGRKQQQSTREGGREEHEVAVPPASQIWKRPQDMDSAEIRRGPQRAEAREAECGDKGADHAEIGEGTRENNEPESGDTQQKWKPGSNQSCVGSHQQQQQDVGCQTAPESAKDAASPGGRLQGDEAVVSSRGVPWTLRGGERGEGPLPGSEEILPIKRHIYCTVYCVENDHPGDNSPPHRGELGAPSSPPRDPTRASLSNSLEPDRFRPPAPLSVSSLIESGLVGSPYSGDYGHLIMLTCRVCLEDKQIKPLPCCKKAVCEECLKRYLSSQVQLSQAEIKCPITECSEHLEETTVLYNLPHDDIIKYKYFLELSRMDSSTKPCPQCKHFTTFKRKGHIPTPAKSENKFKIQCPACQFVWCFKCHSPWHEGVNCKEYRKGDKLLRHWANEVEHGQRNAQKCPKCKIHIQRTEGCDHMTCSQCNTNFCYRCGERYRQLRFFGDHTSNLSIFGCKYRYLPERPHLRRLVRGSVCAGKLLIAPLALVLGLALGAITVLIGLFVFPIYCLCKKQRKRTRTGMPW